MAAESWIDGDDGHEFGIYKPNGARGNRRERPCRDRLIDCADAGEFWHTPQREPFATVPVDGHFENWRIRSKDFRLWLAGQHYDEFGGAAGGQAMEDALRVLEMKALRGPAYPAFLRIGECDGAVYLDLGGCDWRAVEIKPNAWRVVAQPPVKFMRTAAMRALPEPERGESIEQLRPFLNVASEADFKLMVGWLVGAFRPCGPYAMLILNGEQGSSKSTCARILRELIDPRIGGLRALPRDERDLAIAAYNAWCLSFDNLSGLSEWLADVLCRLATGGGFGTRELHSDRDEVVFDAQRPLILNGIPDLAARPDLGDRALAVTLSSIPREARRPESELWAEFNQRRPEILGAVLDAVASAIANQGQVRSGGYERMADFAKWVTAAERGLGWEPGSFAVAYAASREGAIELAVENDPVASAVRALANESETWEGTAGELLSELERFASPKVMESRAWPSAPNVLANRLRRAAPGLRQLGVNVEIGGRAATRDRKRLIVIRTHQEG
jgi:hypothetical protein